MLKGGKFVCPRFHVKFSKNIVILLYTYILCTYIATLCFQELVELELLV